MVDTSDTLISHKIKIKSSFLEKDSNLFLGIIKKILLHSKLYLEKLHIFFYEKKKIEVADTYGTRVLIHMFLCVYKT